MDPIWIAGKVEKTTITMEKQYTVDYGIAKLGSLLCDTSKRQVSIYYFVINCATLSLADIESGLIVNFLSSRQHVQCLVVLISSKSSSLSIRVGNHI